MSKAKDITGNKYNRLTAISFSHRIIKGKEHILFWLFKCECGKKKVMKKITVTGGYTRSCGCLSKKIEVIVGQKFNRLTTIEPMERIPYWLFQCDCGDRKVINKYSVMRGLSKSCGCLLREKAVDITGKKYNKLTAIKFSHRAKAGYCWFFRCDCGNEKVIRKDSVVSGATKSCKCLLKEKSAERGYRHGEARTLLYKKYIIAKTRYKRAGIKFLWDGFKNWKTSGSPTSLITN